MGWLLRVLLVIGSNCGPLANLGAAEERQPWLEVQIEPEPPEGR